jgi:hypothetical protein
MRLAHRARVVALITPGREVIQVEPEIRPRFDSQDMVSVEMFLSPVVPVPEFIQHGDDRRFAHTV